MALPITTTPLDQISKREPSRTAFMMPSGIEIRYTNRVVHRPSEMDTGILSSTKSMTLRSRK